VRWVEHNTPTKMEEKERSNCGVMTPGFPPR
jgi:hypothetical protein